MPFGFDDCAALTGLVVLTFQACAQGLVILSKARGYGRDVSGINLMFELELHKLYAWATEVGLLQEPSNLRIDAQYAAVVPRVLQHLKELVTDVEKLNRAYKLELQETSDQIHALEGEDNTALGRLGVTSSAGDYDNFVKRLFHQRQKPWRVLKWATFDEQKIRALLARVSHFTNELQDILDRTRQARIAKSMDIILRSAVLGTANEQDLDMIGLSRTAGSVLADGEVAAAARLKKRGLLLGVTETIPLTIPDTTDGRRDSKAGIPLRQNSYPPLTPRYSNRELAKMRLSASQFQLPNDVDMYNDCRMLAKYEEQFVLLEFRNNTENEDHDALKDRVCKVSAFLRDLDPSFHGLRCLGYVKLEGRYAFVHDLEGLPAPAPNTHLPACPSFRTLHHLIDTLPSPSLNLRLSYAITVLEALLQLHTSSWLHKEFQPSNTVFILPHPPTTETDFLTATLHILGYAHARADALDDMTEPLSCDLEADLYRHPAHLKIPRKSYRKEFDMFSVGCMLLEIGHWCSLASLLARQCRRKAWQPMDFLKTRREALMLPSQGDWVVSPSASSSMLLKDLEASVGTRYADVVRSLIYASEDGRDGQNALSVEVECLERLRAIAEVV